MTIVSATDDHMLQRIPFIPAVDDNRHSGAPLVITGLVAPKKRSDASGFSGSIGLIRPNAQNMSWSSDVISHQPMTTAKVYMLLTISTRGADDFVVILNLEEQHHTTLWI
tara:strand:+ start:88 stop:417 length:330 start_codon:yes stop_codon:yes gene_type:complete